MYITIHIWQTIYLLQNYHGQYLPISSKRIKSLEYCLWRQWGNQHREHFQLSTAVMHRRSVVMTLSEILKVAKCFISKSSVLFFWRLITSMFLSIFNVQIGFTLPLCKNFHFLILFSHILILCRYKAHINSSSWNNCIQHLKWLYLAQLKVA